MRSEHRPLDISRIELVIRDDLASFDEPLDELAFIYQFFKTLWSGAGPVLTVGDSSGVERAVTLGVRQRPSGASDDSIQHVDASGNNWPDLTFDAVVIAPCEEASTALTIFERLRARTGLGSLFVLPDFTSRTRAGLAAAVGLNADAFELVTRTETTFVYSRQASFGDRAVDTDPTALEAGFARLQRHAARRKDRPLSAVHDAQCIHLIATSTGSEPRGYAKSSIGPTWLERLQHALGASSPFELDELDEIADGATHVAAEGAANAARASILESLKGRSQTSPRDVRTLAIAAAALTGLGDAELATQLLRKALILAGKRRSPADFEVARAAALFLERLGVHDVSVLGLGPTHDGALTTCVQAEDGSKPPLDLTSIDVELASYLDEISSQTTLAERRLLYKFFKTVWAGVGDVLEIGPFLGGTTRAIAMGMLDNPRCSPERKLLTYDRFSRYCMNQEQFDAWVAPVFASGLVAESMKASLGKDLDFKHVFDTIHSGQPYSDIVISRRGSLPIRSDEVVGPDEQFHIEPERELSAVFVDGCKYWYSMKAFMKALSPSTRPGTVYLFQDYSFTDCFFVPIFLEVMEEVFELVSYVDNTYIYRQQSTLTEQMIDERFTDTVEGFGRARFDAIFETLRSKALERHDARSIVIYALQHARVLSYLGDMEQAFRLVDRAAGESRAAAYRWFIDFARRQPLMLPDGRLRSLVWYPNGTRKATSEYREVQRDDGFTMSQSDGVNRTWHPNGALATEVTFREGVRHGPSRAWDDNGTMIAEEQYRHGALAPAGPSLAAVGANR